MKELTVVIALGVIGLLLGCGAGYFLSGPMLIILTFIMALLIWWCLKNAGEALGTMLIFYGPSVVCFCIAMWVTFFIIELWSSGMNILR